MPRGKKPNATTTTTTKQTPVTPVQWVNIKLSQEQVQEVVQLSENYNAIGKALAYNLTLGFMFSVRANTDKENFSAFITGITLSQVEGTFALSGYAPTALGAAASVLIKLDVLLQDQALATTAQSVSGIG